MAATKASKSKTAPKKRTTKTAPKKTASKKAASTTSKKTSKRVAAKKVSPKATKTTSKKASSPKKSVFKKVTDKFQELWYWNLGLALLHAVQAFVVAMLAGKTNADAAFRTEYMTFNEATGTLDTASRLLFETPLIWFVVAFFVMSALAHLLIATVWRKGYEADLKQGMNRARWFEYSLSASTMMVAIGSLVGIVSLPLMVAIFALTAVMNLCGLVMEIQNRGQKKVSWVSFWVGSLAGIIPWLIVAGYFVSSWVYGNGNPPAFVYWIFVSIFVFFNLFAINMWLQYKKIGKWSDYLYGEKAYMVLSLVAKSALAWQVFGGTFQP